MSSIDTLNWVVKTRTKKKQCKVYCQQVRLGFVQEYQDDSITDDDTKIVMNVLMIIVKKNLWLVSARYLSINCLIDPYYYDLTADCLTKNWEFYSRF